MKQPGGVIQSVEAGSLGQTMGLRVGDRLLSINDHPLRDIIDVQFYSAEESLQVLVERSGRLLQFEIDRDYGDGLGLAFVNPTFDVDIRRCTNNCDFCFVKQNSRGMRRSLYIKDDDYRYSFLFGNFVTLTNLTDDDWARLEEQRLSPLYVSVHATDLDLRRRFLARKQAPHIMDQLHRLADLGIEVHTQVVLVPDLNDGQHFAQTIADLTDLYQDPVASIGIVPIGLTKHHPGQCRTHTPEEARAVLDQVEAWQQGSYAQWDSALVYASDEWYLVAGREIPPAREYGGFPQVENGVGMVRQLLDEWDELKTDLKGTTLKSATLVCGALIASVLGQIVDELRALTATKVRLVPVVNQFFGPVTTVSGLLTGQDIIAALEGQSLGEILLLPGAMFTGRYGAGSAPPGMTLDDLMLADIGQELGVRAEMAGTMTEALAFLT